METTSTVHMNEGNPAESELHTERDKDLIKNENAKRKRTGDRRRIYSAPESGHVHENWGGYDNIRDAYIDIFGDALDAHNAKQRKSRQKTIDDFMNDTRTDTRGRAKGHFVNGKRVAASPEEKRTGKPLYYEIVLSYGSTAQDDETPVRYDVHHHEIRPHEMPIAVTKKALRRVVDTWDSRHPHLKKYKANYHADEQYKNPRNVWEWGIDHVHLDFIPYGTGYAAGRMQAQAAISKALGNEGYKDYTDENGHRITAYEQFLDAEREHMEEVLQEEYAKYCDAHPDYAAEHGRELTIIHPYRDNQDKQRGNMTAAEYGKQQDREKALAAQQQRLDKQEQSLDRRRRKIRQDEKANAAAAEENERDRILLDAREKEIAYEVQQQTETIRQQLVRQQMSEIDKIRQAAAEEVQQYADACQVWKSDIVQQLQQKGLTADAEEIAAQPIPAKPDYGADAARLRTTAATQTPQNTDDYNF